MQSKISDQFEDRFINFSISVIKFVSSNSEIPKSVANQVIRSTTSIGANYSEAQNAVSRSDFRNKIGISKKEAAETRYWLRIIEKLVNPESVLPYLRESQEILLILQKIVNTLKAKNVT